MYALYIVLFAALSAFGQEVVPFRIYTEFQNEPLQQVRESIREEAEAIVSPTGWTFVWRSLGEAGEVSIRLAVVRFTGTCSTRNLQKSHFFPPILGATHISDGIILPFADIHCDTIRTLLAPELIKLDPGQRDAAFGMAVGRVVAHELYHILGNTLDHASAGVAEATYSARELLGDDFRFHAREVRVLRNSLVTALLESDGWLQGAARRRGYSVFVKSGCNGCHGLRGRGTQWGPGLSDAGWADNSAALSAHLKNCKSEMNRRAEGLNMKWPRLKARDVKELASFLQSLSEDSVSPEVPGIASFGLPVH